MEIEPTVLKLGLEVLFTYIYNSGAKPIRSQNMGILQWHIYRKRGSGSYGPLPMKKLGGARVCFWTPIY